MKKILKNIITFIINLEARLMLLRYRPRIVAISGTVGKTSTKDLVYQVLNSRLSVRKTQKSLNSELGIPLTILGYESGWGSISSWLKIILGGLAHIIYHPNYPKWLVIETGIDRPGDMDKVAKWLKPEIAIITAFGSVPAHVEYFESPEDVMKEEAKLMDYVREGGAVLLNADDEDVLKLKGKSHVKTYTYGILNTEADILATNSSVMYDEGKPVGIAFKTEMEGNVVPVNVNNVLGMQFIYPSLAAILAGKILGISPVDSSPAIGEFVPAPGRMHLIPGVNNSTIIDDTYNASPLAMTKAIEALASTECSRKKIAILGDMLEIGRFSNSAHEKIGELVAKAKIDILITVGMRAETIGLSANSHRMAKKKIFMFNTSEEAVETVSSLIEEGDLVLAKGSQGIRVEKIVKEIIENPEDSGNLLVRQEKEWLNR